MSRPEVSVVMPFGGRRDEVAQALEALAALDAAPGDELILADNSAALSDARLPDSLAGDAPLRLIPVVGERSPAHARNAGAAHASKSWILFMDADCRPLEGLLEGYFGLPVPEEVGALAGEVVGSSVGSGLVARYGASRNFLSQQAHMSHPYLPRATAANLLVRRAAFEAVGGFYEGVRAGEDTDFSWRLQRAGWRLELRSQARVEHRYRTSLSELRRQWRSYAAGRAWLARRYEDFDPEPAVVRGLDRLRARVRNAARSPARTGGRAPRVQDRLRLAPFAGLDALLALEELAGFALSNRPADRWPARDRPDEAELILVATEFPRRDDPLVELATTLGRARVESLGRPDVPDREAARRLDIRYLEDEGGATKALALLTLAARHPLRLAEDALGRSPGSPGTWSLAPAVLRLEREPRARLHALGGPEAQGVARRLARLAARRIE